MDWKKTKPSFPTERCPEKLRRGIDGGKANAKEKEFFASIPAQVEAEHGSIKKVLLEHPLHDCGGTTRRNGRVSQAQDAVKLGIDKVCARLSLTQAKFLVGDGNALDLEGNCRKESSSQQSRKSMLQMGEKETCQKSTAYAICNGDITGQFTNHFLS